MLENLSLEFKNRRKPPNTSPPHHQTSFKLIPERRSLCGWPDQAWSPWKERSSIPNLSQVLSGCTNAIFRALLHQRWNLAARGLPSLWNPHHQPLHTILRVLRTRVCQAWDPFTILSLKKSKEVIWNIANTSKPKKQANDFVKAQNTTHLLNWC